MKFDGTVVTGLMNAMVGMRLPMSKNYRDALSKIDSIHIMDRKESEDPNYDYEFIDDVEIGPNDLRVAKSLVKGDDSAGHGQPNSKYLRMIHVQCAIEAPLAWWKEFDTYKVGTTANSTSTMHRITNYPIDESCFEKNPFTHRISPAIDIEALEHLRCRYNELDEALKGWQNREEKDEEEIARLKKELKSTWYDLIYGIGDSWLQTRMVDLDYATIHSMYYWRKNHKQNCWSGKDNPEMDYFCKWVEDLPYAKELLTN